MATQRKSQTPPLRQVGDGALQRNLQFTLSQLLIGSGGSGWDLVLRALRPARVHAFAAQVLDGAITGGSVQIGGRDGARRLIRALPQSEKQILDDLLRDVT